jgi:hypothetical protein
MVQSFLLNIELYEKGGWTVNTRLLIFAVIFTVVLSGCSIENIKVIGNRDSAMTQENNKLKDAAKDISNETTQNPSAANSKSSPQSLPVANNSSEVSSIAEKKEVQASKSISLNTRLFNYLSSDKNRKSVAKRASELHGGDLHNSCVYYASESLRRIGIKIPNSMSLVPLFINELKKQGFKTSYNLKDLKPGDICFTTDVNGVFGGRPTHTYIFMGWKSPGVAWIADNQLYDYGNVYHARLIDFHYLNNQKDKPKEATAFFMYK